MKVHLPCFVLTIALFTSSCSDEVIHRSDKPLTRATATTELVDFPFPLSARSVYYLLSTGGMQYLEKYVRFDVDPQDLDLAVEALVVWNNKQMNRSLPYPRLAITEADAPFPQKSFLPIPWWDPSSITTGYYRGHIDGYALRIIVDQERSRIYIYQND